MSGEIPERLEAALAGRYTIERELGEGGMATVYLAQDLKHHRPVALKVLHPELATALGPERFLREIEITARLQHPHILPLLESGEAGGFLYYVMPYVEGESLRQRLARERQLPVEEALRLAREVADALGYAHQRDVVHRDIKPENLLLSGGHAVVADFGIARAQAAAGGERLTRSGVMVGTAAYMSPEQVLASGPLDARSDVYALGCVLYEMLAGEPPFTGVTAESLVHQHLAVEAPLVTTRRPLVPEAVAHAIRRALAKTAADRYATAQQFAEALTAVGAPAATSEAQRAPAGAAAPPAAARRWPPLAVAAAVVAVLALLAGVWLIARRPPPTPAPAARGAIAVMPFSVRGGPQFAYLAEGMVDLLSATLNGAEDLRSTNPHAVIAAASRAGGAPDPDRAREIAAQLGAGRFVVGNVVESGGALRISAALYDQASIRTAASEATVEGHADSLFSLVDALAARLLANLSHGPGARITQLAALTTRSLPALKAYLQGESEYRAGRFEPAAESFQQAIAADTSFALAYYRLSLAAEWTVGRSPELLRSAAERAMRHSARLSDHDRQLLDAFLHWRRGAAADAERLYRAIVAAYPDEIEAWWQLGEVLFHYGPLRGRSVSEAREPFERVLAFDPGHLGALIHLARIAAFESRRTDLDSLTRRILDLHPGSEREISVIALRASVLGEPGAMEKVKADLPGAVADERGATVYHVAIFGHDLAGAVGLGESVVDRPLTPEWRGSWRMMLADIELGRGRWSASKQQLASLGAVNPRWALEETAMLAAVPFVPESRADLEKLRDALAKSEAGPLPPAEDPTSIYALYDGFHPILRLYLLGLVNARLGDAREVARCAGELERLGPGGEARIVAPQLASSLRARIAPPESRDEALALLDRAGIESSYIRSAQTMLFSQVADRLLRADLLEALGRHDEALRWFAAMDGAWTVSDLAFLAPSHLRRAQICEQLGRRDDAIRHYRQFIELWKDCDPELKPMVEDARRRLERLVNQKG